MTNPSNPIAARHARQCYPMNHTMLDCDCLPTMTVAPTTSAGALLAFGARGHVSLPPDNSIRFFDDLYGVPSGDGERNDG